MMTKNQSGKKKMLKEMFLEFIVGLAPAMMYQLIMVRASSDPLDSNEEWFPIRKL